MTTVVLPSVPALGGLYARGAAATGRLAVARRVGRAPRTLPDVVHEVRGVRADADHLTAYQHLVGESASDRLPAGFVHVLAFPVAFAVMVRPDFPLPLLGLVHVANRVEQHAPVRLDEAFDVRAWAQDLRPHRSGTTVDLVAEVRVGGALVWRGVSTYLAKGVRLAGRPDDAVRDEFVAPVPTGRWKLAADAGRRYAAVSGDHNPIHLSRLSAKALGFPRTIAHGMFTAARALADVGAVRGDAFTWTVEFHKPVLLPGTVTVRVAPDGPGTAFAGWDARSGRPHLTGRVDPLR
ncbi:MaoC family dehydratase [Cellulomonas biazotea]|uniref:Acyl dehydratase n=1 Tax=Cellulomonas biazotea TaxID=1709 RepID=A0A402DRQ3_9CELL|nr:MaoC/PaaZ C-terminal domain-containing protein [Cellulomonas biazotea]GCE76791.1 acyl dehydratase [Cellulomonas biazotea]